VPASSATSTASSSPAADARDQKDSKEVTALKAQIKQVQGDLDLLQRELSLENDRFYSNTDYAHDTAGKAILDELKRQVSDKQQELDLLKARLAELQPAQSGAANAPPKP
jgi:exonuclease VII large subunit